MTAGRGIIHSERTRRRGAARAAAPVRHADLGGAAEAAEDDPSRLRPPRRRGAAGAGGRGQAGAPDPRRGLGARAPVAVLLRDCSTPTRCWHPAPRCRCRTSTRIAASMSCEGEVDGGGQTFEAGRMLVFRPGDRISVNARAAGRAADAAGRRHDGRAALPLVELRRLLARSGWSRPRRIGRMAASAACPATRRSSSRCRKAA